MLAYVSAESLARTLQDGDAWFYSRSRQSLWHKGAESGNYLRVKSLHRGLRRRRAADEGGPGGPGVPHGGGVLLLQRT